MLAEYFERLHDIGKSAQGCQCYCCIPYSAYYLNFRMVAYPVLVFSKCHVPYMMQLVFYVPVISIQFEQFCCPCILLAQARYSICMFFAAMSPVLPLAHYMKYLFDFWPAGKLVFHAFDKSALKSAVCFVYTLGCCSLKMLMPQGKKSFGFQKTALSDSLLLRI